MSLPLSHGGTLTGLLKEGTPPLGVLVIMTITELARTEHRGAATFTSICQALR